MSDEVWNVGDLYPASASFRNIAGALADPTTVTLTVIAPDGTVTTPTPVHPSTGLYTYNVPLTQGENWVVHWAGTGTVTKAKFERFYVIPNPIPVVEEP